MTPAEGDWFQVSGRGNGVGLTALRDHVGRRLYLHVLPKLWRTGARPKNWAWSGRASWDPDEERHAVVHEGDSVEFPTSWARLIGTSARREVVADGHAVTQDNGLTAEGEPVALHPGSDELGAADSLWKRTVRRAPEDTLPLTEAPPSAVAALWRLFDAHPDVVSPAFDSSRREHRGDALLLRLDQLRPYLLHRFVEDVERLLPQRRSRFVEVSEALTVLRGRVPVAGLLERAARRRIPVQCEFDELTGDEVVWQTIRAAVGLCAQDLNGHALETALLCDTALGDVSVVPLPALLSRAREADSSARHPDVRSALRLGLAILRHQHHLAAPSDETSAVGVELKVATSTLWEKLVARVLSDAGFGVHTSGASRTVAVFSGTSKQIDIVVTERGSAVLLMDAKYKAVPTGGWTGVAMGDAYQLYSYVNRRGCPGLLVYPGRDGSRGGLDSSRLALGTRGDQSGDLGHPVGIMVVPFPGEGEVSCRLSPQILESLRTISSSGADPSD